MKIKPFNQLSNIYNKTSQGRKGTLMPFMMNIVDITHNKKKPSITYGLSAKIGEFNLMGGNSTSTTKLRRFTRQFLHYGRW